MASGALKVYSLGLTGVILDRDPINPTLPDGALIRAQNATHDPTAQRDGGALRKRPGLKRFNTVTAGGAILGGITMAIAGTGGAPVAVGAGLTGTPAGSGDGTGSAGGTIDGGTVSTFAAAGAGAFSGSSLFSGVRLVAIARADNTISNQNGQGWYLVPKNASSSATKVAVPGPPGGVYNFPPTALFPYCLGSTLGVYHAASGYYFYAAGHLQISGTQATIRKTNGAVDVLVATIPYNTDTPHNAVTGFCSTAEVNTGTDATHRQAITGLHLGSNGLIYVAVKDKAGGQTTAGNCGRVYSMDAITGILTQINTNSGAAYTNIPYTLAYFAGSLYWGEFNLVTSELQKDTTVVIRATSTDFSQSVIEHGFSDGEGSTVLYPFPQTAPASNPGMNVIANQRLFLGFGVNKTVPTYAILYQRDRSAPRTALAYTASLVATSGVAAGNGNHFSSMIAFNDNLYAAYYNGTESKIYKFVPTYTNLAADGGWDGTGTWSTVFTGNSGGASQAYQLFVDDGVMYAIGGVKGVPSIGHVLTTTDGTSWTDRTANFPIAGATQDCPIPLLFGMAQS